MDFFEHQEQARRRTGLLIFYFCLAVAGIVLATYALAAFLFLVLGEDQGTAAGAAEPSLWNPGLFVATALGTGGVVFLASLFKTAQLSGGGSVVARELGGRELDLNTTDFHERRLLNVVEEMAIASGIPAPTVYVLDAEDSINAFAAGRSVSDAVVGVTRGCMTLLTRDELQGVVAHEFSHILNGDMKLNIRLMGVLFGILFLALMGEMILRFGVRGGFSSGRREGAGAALVLLVAGLGLLVIGWVGSFFAKLIKASVSRQREYLADASAVQFTRNPEGLAGALIKLGGLSSRSDVTHPMARDASHLFFGNAFRSRSLATHPPLTERIRRILPHWDGQVGPAELRPVTRQTDRHRASELSAAGVSGLAPAASSLSAHSAETPLSESEALESMRTVHPEQIALAGSLLLEMPNSWIESCHHANGAQAMVFAMLLAQDEALRTSELESLRQDGRTSEVFERTIGLFGEIREVHSRVKFALVDLCIPTLRRLSLSEYREFRRRTQELIESDGQVDLFEFALLKVIHRHLDSHFERSPLAPIRHRDFRHLGEELGVLLSTLAAMSHPHDEDEIRAAFEAAASPLESAMGRAVPFLPAERCGLAEIDAALRKLEQASPVMKRDLLAAASRSVLADGAVSSREAELIRAVADALGCPIPPFVKAAPSV